MQIAQKMLVSIRIDIHTQDIYLVRLACKEDGTTTDAKCAFFLFTLLVKLRYGPSFYLVML